MLQGKQIVLGISGGIAAYKACDLIGLLKRAGATVDAVMTRNATEFISPLTVGTLTGRDVAVEQFAMPKHYEVEHISLAKRADILVIAPATANIIGKLANGIADDMLTTVALATRSPILIAPAMNTAMYENPVVQENIERLRGRGVHIVPPVSGRLACGDTGNGKLASVETIFAHIVRQIAYPKDLVGKRVLVTAGPTREALDPVRFLSNRSSGKMGYALAEAAANRGAQVTLVSGPVVLEPPLGVEVVSVESAREMEAAVLSRGEQSDIIIKAAAVGDFRPAVCAEQKIKKQEEALVSLVRNPDILKELGQKKWPAVLVGFSMETEDLLANSQKKLREKQVDLLVANDLTTPGAGFLVDTNVVTLLRPNQPPQPLEQMSKRELAHVILTEANKIVK